jgi:tetratricopeptide (TPR) repeat protein
MDQINRGSADQSPETGKVVVSRVKNLKGRARTYSRQAEILRRSKRFHDAYAMLIKEGEIYIKLRDKEGLAANLMEKGVLFALMGDSKKALNLFEASAAHARDNPQQLAQCYKHIEDLYKKTNKKTAAAEMYKKARQLYRESNDISAPVPIQQEALFQPPTTTSSALSPTPQIDTSAWEISTNTQKILDRVTLLTDITKKDYDPLEAEQLLKNSINRLQVTGSRADRAALMEKLGDVYYVPLALEEHALSYLKRAEDAWQNLGHTRQAAACIGKQAAVLIHNDKLKEAFDYLKREAELCLKLNDRLQLACCYDKYAWIYRQKFRWNDALEYLRKGEQLLQKLGEEGFRMLAENWWQQGSVYSKKKEFHKQARYWKLSVELSRKKDSSNSEREKRLEKLIKNHKIKL